MESEKFSWSILEHRMLVQAISMTASDLSASTKPWEIQVQTVRVIFEEFYQQGDAERAAGRKPISMMDRFQPDQQAISQVGFLSCICIPCYTLLYRLIPSSEILLQMCQENLSRWQTIADEVSARKGDKMVKSDKKKDKDNEKSKDKDKDKDGHKDKSEKTNKKTEKSVKSDESDKSDKSN